MVIFLYVVFGTQKRPWYHWDDALQMKYCLKQWSYDIRFLIIDIQKSIWLDLLRLFSCWYFSSYTIITSGQTLLFKKAPHYKLFRYYLWRTTSVLCSSNLSILENLEIILIQIMHSLVLTILRLFKVGAYFYPMWNYVLICGRVLMAHGIYHTHEYGKRDIALLQL